MLRDELERYLNHLLSINSFQDYCPNGLQIEGAQKIKKIITGVTASQALIDCAIAEKADAILVHHGYFWKGEASAISGIKKRRIKSLLEHDISLFAYHLPLDAHPEFGNNVQLAKLLGLKPEKGLEKHGAHDLGLVCSIQPPVLLSQFQRLVSERIVRDVLVLGPKSEERLISKVGLCTGGAQSMFEAAITEHQIDAYITGEVSEQNFHAANEYACNFLSIGHHASERYGARAIGEHLSDKFSLDVQFIDIDNPI